MKLINKIEKAFSNLFGEKKTDKYGPVVEANSWANATQMGSILHSLCSNRASMILSEGVQYAPENQRLFAQQSLVDRPEAMIINDLIQYLSEVNEKGKCICLSAVRIAMLRPHGQSRLA